MALHVLAYNLTHVINIIGPGRLIAAIRIWAVAMRLSPDAMYLALAVTAVASYRRSCHIVLTGPRPEAEAGGGG